MKRQGAEAATFLIGYHHAGKGRRFWDGREFTAESEHAATYGSCKDASAISLALQPRVHSRLVVYKRKNLLVDGEYNQVAQWSRRPDLLEKAHGTPIKKADVVALIHLLSDAACVPRPAVYFTSKKGVANATFRWIKLPPVEAPLEPHRYGKLRVGLVLHELAHIVAGPGHHHDRIFVACLDKLLLISEEMGIYRTT